jgi:hypothetical protein
MSGMHAILDFLIDASKLAYLAAVGVVTLVVFYYGIDLPLYLLVVPVALVALGALATQRSWYGLALVVGVTVLMVLPLYLQVSEGF